MFFCDLAAGRRVDRQHPEDRAVRDEMVERVVKEAPDGGVVAPHRLLHAADRADHVRLVDHVRAAASHEEVLGVVGHADDLVRNHLSGRDDEVVLLVHDPLVDFHRDGIRPESLGNLLHGLGGHLAELHHVRAPAVHDHPLVGDVAEHRLPLRLGDGHVRAERGHDVHVHALRRQQPPVDLCDVAGVGVEAREVRRDDQHVAKRAPLERLLEKLGDLVVRETLFGFGNREYVRNFHVVSIS